MDRPNDGIRFFEAAAWAAALVGVFGVVALATILVLSLGKPEPVELRVLSYTIQQSKTEEPFAYERSPLPLTHPVEGQR